MDADTIYRRRWWTLAVLCLSVLIILIDNTVLNVALPTLVRDLGATTSQLQWIVDSYILVFAGLLLTAGSLSDRFGRKRVLSVGLLLFGIASVLSSLATTPGQLIAARALMGIGGSAIFPPTLSILTNVFPPAERGKAIAIWAGMSGLGVALGPILGGFLLENFYWGSVFLVNVPIVTLALVGGRFLIPESRDPRETRLDPAGAVLSIAGLSVLLFAIISAPERGWADPLVLGGFALAVALIAVFLWYEARIDHPMLDVRLFTNRRFSAANGAVTLVFFALLGSLFFVTQYMQYVLGFTPLQAGVRVLPVAVSIVVAANLSRVLVERLGTKVVVTAGLSLVAIALGVVSNVTLETGYGLISIFQVLLGLGLGLTIAPSTESVMGAVPRDRAGVGSAVNDTTRQVGGALGVAVLGSLLASGYRAGIAEAVASLPRDAAAAASDSVGAAAAVAARLPDAAQGQELLDAARASFVDALDSTVLFAMAAALLGALIVVLFLPSRPAPATAPGRGEPLDVPTRTG